MTPAETTARVQRILKIATGYGGDAEYAHSEEDRLHQDVLGYFAKASPEPFAEIARIALSTTEIDFPRWCA